jgi:hypothetical protein
MAVGMRTSFILAALLLGLAGCTSYEAVTPAASQVRIALLPIANQSDLPQIIAPLARNLREQLAHSPNWDLVNEDRADVKLQVTVQSMNRRAISRDPEDTGRPISFREEVVVDVEWISDLPCPWGPDNILRTSSDHILYTQPSLPDASASGTAAMTDRIASKIVERMHWATPSSAN